MPLPVCCSSRAATPKPEHTLRRLSRHAAAVDPSGPPCIAAPRERLGFMPRTRRHSQCLGSQLHQQVATSWRSVKTIRCGRIAQLLEHLMRTRTFDYLDPRRRRLGPEGGCVAGQDPGCNKCCCQVRFTRRLAPAACRRVLWIRSSRHGPTLLSATLPAGGICASAPRSAGRAVAGH
jgi:hypothetical protein